MALMKSSHTHTFNLFNEEIFYENNNNSSKSIKNQETIRFSAQFWQPFIDVEFNDVTNATTFTGPFLGLLFEIAKKLKVGVTYVGPDDQAVEVHFRKLGKGLVDLFLYPAPPTDLNNWPLFQPSETVGVVHMIAILSASREAAKPLFNFSRAFTRPTWLLVCGTFLFFSLISLFLEHFWSQHLVSEFKLFSQIKKTFKIIFKTEFSEIKVFFSERCPLLTNVRVMLYQSQRLQRSNYKTSQLIIIFFWQFGALFMIWMFFNKMLEFTIYPDPLETVDSLEDVDIFLKKGHIKGLVGFEGESIDFFSKENNCLAKNLKPFLGLTTPEGGRTFWEEKYLPLIHDGEIVFVSDDAFLDYYHNAFLHRYPKLFRSSADMAAHPFVIPMGKKKLELNRQVNLVIKSLIEQGIFQQWISETLELNNKALHLGLIDDDVFKITKKKQNRNRKNQS